MPNNTKLPECPTGCDSTLNPVKFNICTPEIVESEIVKIYVTNQGVQAFTDWTTASEWTDRISETSTEANAIRALTVIGDKPQPTAVTREISNGRTMVLGKDHTINFTIDDVSKENYDFLTSTECSGKYKIWYEVKGGYIYGGNDGIDVNLVMDHILNRGSGEIETINGVATWRSKRSPERTKSPITT